MNALKQILDTCASEIIDSGAFENIGEPKLELVHDILNSKNVMVTLHSFKTKQFMVYVNDQARDFYGFEKNDLSYMNQAFYMRTFHPKTYHRLVHSYQFFNRNDLGYFSVRYLLKNATGEYEKVNGSTKTIVWNDKNQSAYTLSVTCREPEQAFLNASVIWDLSEINERPKNCLKMLLKGMANKQIADEMGVSIKTVENHLQTIYSLTGVHSRSELIQTCTQF